MEKQSMEKNQIAIKNFNLFAYLTEHSDCS